MELNLISADPGLLGDPTRYIEATFRPGAERVTGNLGASPHADRESGALVVESFFRHVLSYAGWGPPPGVLS